METNCPLGFRNYSQRIFEEWLAWVGTKNIAISLSSAYWHYFCVTFTYPPVLSIYPLLDTACLTYLSLQQQMNERASHRAV